jgi:formylglycine-generating enzyme required for sulfatase activity
MIMAALLLSATIAQAQGDDLLVYRVQAAQLPLTGLVDVWYKLQTVGGGPVRVRLYLSTDGGISYPFLCQAVTGDVGDGVLPGASRHIVWNAGADFPGFSSATCQLRVTADDGFIHLGSFVPIAPGTFIMGSPTDEPGRQDDETQHQVTLTHGIYVQTTEVTNQQYMEMAQWAYDRGYATVATYNVSDNLDGSTQELFDLSIGGSAADISFSGGDFSCINPTHPVRWVTWYASVAYCDWLSLQQGLPRAYNHSTWQCNGGSPYAAAGYRLPTEAEWEYACRAGSTTAFANGPITQLYCEPIDQNLDLMGWYCGDANYWWRRPVAQKLPNAWGLYDMHGNLWEWCNDWYDLYGGTVTDPVGPGAGSWRVFRGGECSAYAQYCRSALRGAYYPRSVGEIGFRPVRSAN